MTDREFTTGLFLARCLELGISATELHMYDVGMIMDILTEKANDAENYNYVATQDDFDRF